MSYPPHVSLGFRLRKKRKPYYRHLGKRIKGFYPCIHHEKGIPSLSRAGAMGTIHPSANKDGAMDTKNEDQFSVDWFDATGRMKESSHPWLDSLPLCLLVINQEYRIVGYNKQAGKLFHNPPKLVNHDVCKLCYVETDIPILRNFIDAGLRQSLSLVIKGRYKEPLHVKIHATRVDTHNWFVFIEDNTETFLLEEEARNLRSAINFAADAIYLFDEQGLIFFTNPAFERQFDRKAEEIVGKT
ncbi:PAS domain-containing protein, partial [bacterium]|nr:PAS domain-containing protein [bacterium]